MSYTIHDVYINMKIRYTHTKSELLDLRLLLSSSFQLHNKNIGNKSERKQQNYDG